MRKFILFLISFILFIGIIGVCALYYVRPDPTLTLDYTSVSIKDKALDMVKKMSPEIMLTEEDINNLLKEELAEHASLIPDVEVRGAHFTLSGNRLSAELRMMWKDRIPVGVQVKYVLAWNKPDLIATVESIRMKEIALPAKAFERLVIPIEQHLPDMIGIKDFQFGEHGIVIKLRADIPDLLGLRADS